MSRVDDTSLECCSAELGKATGSLGSPEFGVIAPPLVVGRLGMAVASGSLGSPDRYVDPDTGPSRRPLEWQLEALDLQSTCQRGWGGPRRLEKATGGLRCPENSYPIANERQMEALDLHRPEWQDLSQRHRRIFDGVGTPRISRVQPVALERS